MSALTTSAPETQRLTPKQLDVLVLASDLGFYNTPRDANLDALAHVLGISKAAVHTRLQTAERKVIADYVAATRAGEAAYYDELARRARARNPQEERA